MSKVDPIPGGISQPRCTRKTQPLHVVQVGDALLRISTVEAISGLSKSTIYAKAARNEFPQPIRIGARCTRFRAADVMAWLAARAA
jgi:prophage regulatory protein